MAPLSAVKTRGLMSLIQQSGTSQLAQSAAHRIQVCSRQESCKSETEKGLF